MWIHSDTASVSAHNRRSGMASGYWSSDNWIRYILVKLVIPSIIDGHYLNERVSGSVKPKRWNRKESKSIKEAEEKPVVKTSKKRKTDFDYDHQPIHYDNEENLAEDIFGLLGF